MVEEQTLSCTLPCAESRVQSLHAKDMSTALFSWEQSQNGGNFFTSNCHTAFQMAGSLPVLAYCHGLFAYIFLAFCLLLSACSLVAPLQRREKTTRQHPFPCSEIQKHWYSFQAVFWLVSPTSVAVSLWKGASYLSPLPLLYYLLPIYFAVSACFVQLDFEDFLMDMKFPQIWL